MVAITVILAAVIAAFVLDLGGSISEEAQAGVNIEADSNQVTATWTSQGNSDYIKLSSECTGAEGNEEWDPDTGAHQLDNVGNSISKDCSAGTATAIAVTEDGTETVVQTESWDFD